MQRKARPGCAVVLIISFLVMVGVYIFFAGDRIPDLVVLNNTGQKITVSMQEKTTTVDPDSIGELKSPFYDLISIETEKNEKFNYRWVPLQDQKYVKNYCIHLQIEADLKIYVLPFRADRVVEQLSEQPRGYPMEPRKE